MSAWKESPVLRVTMRPIYNLQHFYNLPVILIHDRKRDKNHKVTQTKISVCYILLYLICFCLQRKTRNREKWNDSGYLTRQRGQRVIVWIRIVGDLAITCSCIPATVYGLESGFVFPSFLLLIAKTVFMFIGTWKEREKSCQIFWVGLKLFAEIFFKFRLNSSWILVVIF